MSPGTPEMGIGTPDMAAISPLAGPAPTHNDGASWWPEQRRWSIVVARFRAGEGGGAAAMQQFVSLVIISHPAVSLSYGE